MRIFVLVLLSIPALTAYDAVLFSNEQRLTKHHPTIENIVSTASASSPVVFIVNPDFNLAQFSKQALAYSLDNSVSGLPAIVKSSSYYSDRYLDHVFHTPDAVTVTPNDDVSFPLDASIYILEGEEWVSMESLAQAVLPRLSPNYTAVITSSEAVSIKKNRVKRVVTSEMESSFGVENSKDAGSDLDMPISLPPYNRTGYSGLKPMSGGLGSCMLYMEGVNIVVENNKKMFATIPIRSLVNTTTWSYVDGDVECNESTSGNYTFIVRLKLKADVHDAKQQVKISQGSQVIFKLVFTGDRTGYWGLSNVEAQNLVVDPVTESGHNFISHRATAEKTTTSSSVGNVGFNSVAGFAMACSDSQAAFFKTDHDGVLIGISLYNTEVQTVSVYNEKTKRIYFTSQVEDCVGTFSTGSWMAIVSSLIMFSGFLFGYLMLNSVQTMDRFDDPKHKQIVINVRE